MVVYSLVYSAQYKRDYKRVKKRGANLNLLYDMLRKVAKQCFTPPDKDHALRGEYHGCRECHIKGDWVLVYEQIGNTIVLRRTGTHSDIFKKRY